MEAVSTDVPPNISTAHTCTKRCRVAPPTHAMVLTGPLTPPPAGRARHPKGTRNRTTIRVGPSRILKYYTSIRIHQTMVQPQQTRLTGNTTRLQDGTTMVWGVGVVKTPCLNQRVFQRCPPSMFLRARFGTCTFKKVSCGFFTSSFGKHALGLPRS